MNDKIDEFISILKEDLEKIKLEIEKLSILQIKVIGKLEVLDQLKEELSKNEEPVVELPEKKKNSVKKE